MKTAVYSAIRQFLEEHFGNFSFPPIYVILYEYNKFYENFTKGADREHMGAKRVANINDMERFIGYLWEMEKSTHTMTKYRRDVLRFVQFCNGRPLEKSLTMEYKESLKTRYKTVSVNSMLVAMNGFLEFLGRSDCRVKTIKMQRKIFCEEKQELSKKEYERLLRAARQRRDHRLYLVLQTICGTGIRVSELQYITVEAVHRGRAVVECKNKQRVILLPQNLLAMLRGYIRQNGLAQGPVFRSRSGNALDRTLIWRAMKSLCKAAGVAADKVFPHNLRHLFARTFYKAQHDLARLADLLGHSSIETTRIYLLTTSRECFGQISQLGLIAT